MMVLAGYLDEGFSRLFGIGCLGFHAGVMHDWT